jgi:putative transcriptional regulator
MYDSPVIKIRLEELLQQKGKSLYALAKETGISYSALWKMNKGEVTSMSFEVLEKVCTNLDCEIGDLLTIQAAKAK